MTSKNPHSAGNIDKASNLVATYIFELVAALRHVNFGSREGMTGSGPSRAF